jgi:hypothetical protein
VEGLLKLQVPRENNFLGGKFVRQGVEPVVELTFEVHGFFPGEFLRGLAVAEGAARDFPEYDVQFGGGLDGVAVLGGDGSGADQVEEPALAVPGRALLGVREGGGWN